MDYRRYHPYRRGRRSRSRLLVWGVLIVGLVVVILLVRGTGGKGDDGLTIEGTFEESSNASTGETSTNAAAPTTTAPAGTFDLAGCTGPLSRGTRQNEVSLTFNAVSSAGRVSDIVRLLKEKGVPADFFVTGKWVEANTKLFSEVSSAGFPLHTLGYSYADFTQMDAAKIQEELEKTDAAFTAAGIASSKPLFRPPYGSINAAVTDAVKQYGYCPILWTVDAFDWQEGQTEETAKARVLERVSSGGIVVMQTSNGVTPELVGPLVDELKEKDLTIVPLTQLLTAAQ